MISRFKSMFRKSSYQKHQPEVQAELCRIVFEGNPENAKFVKEHSELLDCDILISTVADESCNHDQCLRILELDYDVTYNMGSDSDVEVQEVLELVRKGHCSCFETSTDPDFPNVTSSVCYRLIHLAASQKHLWLLKLLAEYDCTLDVMTSAKVTALVYSVRRNHTEGVKFLLSQGVDVNLACTYKRMTPLMEAVDCCEYEIFLMLLRAHKCALDARNWKGETAVYMAVQHSSGDFLEKLIEARADVNICTDEGDSALLRAVYLDRVDQVQRLLKQRVDVNVMNSTGVTPLYRAFQCNRENEQLMELLLDAGADPNVKNPSGISSLIYAASIHNDYCNYKMVKAFISHGADVNAAKSSGYTAMHIAAWYGHAKSVKELLQAGAKHDLRACDKNTPIALAAHGNHPSVIDMLLPLDCDLNNADKDKDTPLHYAAYNNMAESVEKLIASGANPNVRNRLDTTPLWNAVYRGSKEVVKILLAANVDIEVPSKGIPQDGQHDFVFNPMCVYDVPRSPLWVAVSKNFPDIVMLLIAAGYNIYGEAWLKTEDYPESSSTVSNEKLCSILSHLLITPPSLLSLCRSSIRKRFEGKQINVCVDQIAIPKFLKSYLMLNELLHQGFEKLSNAE